MSRRGTDVVDYFQASAVCSHYEKLRNVQRRPLHISGLYGSVVLSIKN